jgi:hypothetical protein
MIHLTKFKEGDKVKDINNNPLIVCGDNLIQDCWFVICRAAEDGPGKFNYSFHYESELEKV